jgi:hypothetical protein
MVDSKFKSRKFIVTMFGVTGTFVLAYFGKMTGDVAMVVAAGLAMYNYSQGKVDEAKEANEIRLD